MSALKAPWFVKLGWADLALAVTSTIIWLKRPDLAGLTATALFTQALMIAGMHLRLNSAAIGYALWSLIAMLMSATGGDVYADDSFYANAAAWVGGFTTVAVISGMLSSKGKQWLTGPEANNVPLGYALLWVAVTPAALGVGAIAGTPTDAVLIGAVPSWFGAAALLWLATRKSVGAKLSLEAPTSANNRS